MRNVYAPYFPVTRQSQKVDVVYHCEDNGSAFFTPDGEGRVYFDTLAEALEETGLEFVYHVHSSQIVD